MRSYFKTHDLEPADVEALLSSAGVEPGIRGEKLSSETYLEMARAWNKLGTSKA